MIFDLILRSDFLHFQVVLSATLRLDGKGHICLILVIIVIEIIIQCCKFK